jgi:hypothetical protein
VATLALLLSTSGCAAESDDASRLAYLDTMCPLAVKTEAFVSDPSFGDPLKHGPMAAEFSLVSTAAADELDAFPWSANVGGHIPAISEALRGEAAFWASAAVSPTGLPSYPLSPDVIQAGDDARAAVYAALQIDFAEACGF